MKKIRNLLILLLIVLAGITGFWLGSKPDRTDIKSLLPQVKKIKYFDLINSAGGNFTLKDLKNKLSIITIGYANCPDVCLDTLNKYKEIKELLKNKPSLEKEVQFIFISIDPERDKPKILKQYVKHFDKSFIGLTGSEAKLKTVTKDLLASYVVQKTEHSYDVAHTAYFHIIDKQGDLTAIISPPINPKQMVAILEFLTF